MSEQIEEWFDQADNLLFNENKYDQAQQIYEKILAQDASNIDAINSIAYCVKYRAKNQPDFDELKQLYDRSLSLDPEDIEANFNLGLMYL
jgi:tetratricopeptide (TPR) repeat protein